MRDAGAVRDDQRRARGRRSASRKARTVCASFAPHRDARDVDVAVGHREQAEVLLARSPCRRRRTWPRRRAAWPSTAGRRCSSRPRCRARARSRLAPEREHVVEAAVADVVGPAVAADDPDALAARGGRRARRGGRASGVVDRRASARAQRRRRARAARRSAPRRRRRAVEERVDERRRRAARASSLSRARAPGARARRRASRMPRPNSALSSKSEFDQAGPRPSRVGRVRRRRQVAAVDRRAAGGVGDQRAGRRRAA